MPTCLLTGATGFLGAHVARALLARGWTVRALIRGGPARIPELVRSGVEVVSGDLSPQNDLASATAGADAIVHVAGVTNARTLEEYREVNVRGTERLARAARGAASNALFLLVSSQAAAGPATRGRPVRDGDPPRPVSWYGLSKREGEEALACNWPGARVVIRPSVVFGPGDRGLLLLFRAASRGVVPVASGRSLVQLIRAERAAAAIAEAAARPDLDRRTGFLCDPEPISIARLSEEIAALPPRRPIIFPLPRLVLQLAGAFETTLEALTRRSRPFNADKVREMLAGDWICDGGPLSRDLKLPPPTPLPQDLAETWAWYAQAGWLL